MNRTLLLSVLILLTVATRVRVSAQRPYTEKYRPQYHFSPLKGWTGDPDGLVKYEGVYHLFWWGHAISKDLVHWREMPYPIKGNTHNDGINSGGAIIDTLNVAGFGKNALIGFHSIEDTSQTIGISSSLDYTYLDLYSGNPVLKNKDGGHDFRDPHVFWYESTRRWIMVVAMGIERRLTFYASTDLKSWTYLSSYGPDMGVAGDNWETPDMFMLPLDGDKKNKKWVLTIAAGTDKMQYFIGSFDGKNFTNDQPGQYLAFDFGKDFYAARTWRDFDSAQQSTIIMGWLGSWDYAPHVPSKETYNGQGVESIPRTLELIRYPEGMRLRQTPIAALRQLRDSGVSIHNVAVSGVKDLSAIIPYKSSKNVYEMEAVIRIHSAIVGLNLLVDPVSGRSLVIRYDPTDSVLSVDRRKTTDASFCCHFPVMTQAKVSAQQGILHLHIYVDQSSVEIFVNDGKTVCSMLTFPAESQTGIELFSKNGTAVFSELTIWPLRSIW